MCIRDRHWDRIERILNGLHYQNMDKFHDLKTASLDKYSGEILYLLKNFNKDLNDLKNEASDNTNEIKSMNTKIDVLSQTLKNDVEKIRKEVQSNKEENKETRKEVQSNKEENKEIRKEVQFNKEENKEIRREVQSNKEENKEIRKKVNEIMEKNSTKNIQGKKIINKPVSTFLILSSSVQ